MIADFTDQATLSLLSFSLVSVLAIGMLAGFLGLIYFRRNRTSPSFPSADTEEISVSRTFRPSLIEHNFRWIAVKGSQVGAVQAALDLHNPRPCSWGDGLMQVTHQRLFISPPIRGWILVIGPALPDPSEDIDRCFHFVSRLSRNLGHTQFFSINRAVNHHAWVRADSGRVRRAYAWAGETLWNQGELTQAEQALEVHCFGYGQSPEHLSEAGDLLSHNTEKVTQLAARWSLDPTAIDDRAFRAAMGVAGELLQSRPH